MLLGHLVHQPRNVVQSVVRRVVVRKAVLMAFVHVMVQDVLVLEIVIVIVEHVLVAIVYQIVLKADNRAKMAVSAVRGYIVMKQTNQNMSVKLVQAMIGTVVSIVIVVQIFVLMESVHVIHKGVFAKIIAPVQVVFVLSRVAIQQAFVHAIQKGVNA